MNSRTMAGAAAAALLLLFGCTVKEDRDLCPCWLEIDLGGCGEFTPDGVTLRGWTPDGGAVIGARVPSGDFGEDYEAEVPRGTVSYCAWCAEDSSLQKTGRVVTIAEGEESPELYAYLTTLITECETLRDRVRLHRQHAAVTMAFEKAEGMTPFRQGVTVRSGWCGWDLTDLSAVAGPFRFSPERQSDGTFRFTLPRQGDDSSLEVDIYRDGTLTETVELGRILSEAGYDWGAEDLEDIYVGIDWGRGALTVKVEGWKEGFVKELTL